ncbi:hypothetical protein JTB14_022446 [Gonioctena quinquepunctata]|nr:hypothetical protein JTB14_022446 [Gonioctena quinquepunctata]
MNEDCDTTNFVTRLVGHKYLGAHVEIVTSEKVAVAIGVAGAGRTEELWKLTQICLLSFYKDMHKQEFCNAFCLSLDESHIIIYDGHTTRLAVGLRPHSARTVAISRRQ